MLANDTSGNKLIDTCLLSCLARHVPLCALQCPEGFPEVELNVISLSFHAYSEEESPLRIQVKPVFSRSEVREMSRIKLQCRAPNIIMIANGVPVPNSCDDVERTGCHDIHCVVPSGIEVVVDYARFGYTLLVLIGEYDVGVTKPVHVASFQIFRLDDFDREHVTCGALGSFGDGWGMLREDFGAAININILLQLVELLDRIFDVVELDK